MIGFLARRLAWAALVLMFIVGVTFVLTYLIPADPATLIAGPKADAQTRAEIRRQYHLDRPYWVQFGFYVRGLVHGDFGRSYATDREVLPTILSLLPNTVLLALAAMVLQLVIGLPVGVVAAVWRNRPADYLTMAAALVGISLPSFVVGVLLISLFAARLNWFPIGGIGSGRPLDTLWHLALPAGTLAIIGAAYYSRLLRSDMIEVLGQEYIRTARAKGLPEWRVVWGHAFRNALLPVVTLAGMDLGALMGGAVITEAVFTWPGVGRLAIDSVFQNDGPMIVGTVLFAALFLLVANIVVDASYTLLDPRVRLE